MTEGELLLRGVLNDPADGTARLVFADWLEERGEGARARFIRNEVAASAPPSVFKAGWPCRVSVFRDTSRMTLGEVVNLPPEPIELVELAPPVPGVSWATSRGMVCGIELPCEAFMTHAEAIFRVHPVTSVVLVDKSPWVGRHGRNDPQDNLWGWWRAWSPSMNAVDEFERDTLPHELMAIVDRDPRNLRANPTRYDSRVKMGSVMFDSAELASAVLSDSCVARGRALAGLPPLPVHEKASCPA